MSVFNKNTRVGGSPRERKRFGATEHGRYKTGIQTGGHTSRKGSVVDCYCLIGGNSENEFEITVGDLRLAGWLEYQNWTTN